MNLVPALDAVSQKTVDALVQSGAFASSTEVVKAGIALVQERQALMEKAKTELGRALAQAEAGEVVEFDEAFDMLRDEIEKVRKRAA